MINFNPAAVFSYWYMFPFCVAVASIAIAGGIGGATFLVPFLILAIKVPVVAAVAIGIFVEIFGFFFGVYDHGRRGHIDYYAALKIIAFSSLFVVTGVALNHLVVPTVVEYVFIFALMVFATQILLIRNFASGPRKFDAISAAISALGGLLFGFLGSGLGEANEYNLFVRLKKEPDIAAGTSVLAVAVSAAIATAVQFYFFLQTGSLRRIYPYAALIAYAIAGAFVGAYLGSTIISKISREKFRIFISALLYAVAASSLVKVVFIS